jgi:hypothetical protein
VVTHASNPSSLASQQTVPARSRIRRLISGHRYESVIGYVSVSGTVRLHNRAHHVECYRFSSAAKATRHPIEEFPPKLHGGLVMEANEIRYRASEILGLYHRPYYTFAKRS